MKQQEKVGSLWGGLNCSGSMMLLLFQLLLDAGALMICRLFTHEPSISMIPYSRKNGHPFFCQELVALAKDRGVKANGKKASTDLALGCFVLVGPGVEMFHTKMSQCRTLQSLKCDRNAGIAWPGNVWILLGSFRSLTAWQKAATGDAL